MKLTVDSGRRRADAVLAYSDPVQLIRLGHAALLFETPYVRVLCDPGSYSSDWHHLTDLDAVAVTHQHQDHVDMDGLMALMEINPTARLMAEAAVAEMLTQRGLSPEVAVVGETFQVGPARIEVHGGTHAVIHPSIPPVGNVGYLFQEGDGARVFHPGDSYDHVREQVDLLALPITAPWANMADTAAFLAAVSPREAIPIHDAILSDAGRALYRRLVSQVVGEGIPLHPVGPTDSFSV